MPATSFFGTDIINKSVLITLRRRSLWVNSTSLVRLLQPQLQSVKSTLQKKGLYNESQKKTRHQTLVHNFAKYWSIFNIFTVTLTRKFAIKRSLQIPPHLNGVATLPCKILVSGNIACHICWDTVKYKITIDMTYKATSPFPVIEVRGYYHRKIIENIDANLCNLLHFGVKYAF